ncbi:class IV lanthionine synthetase LanL [Spirillospora sp. CA-253888]
MLTTPEPILPSEQDLIDTLQERIKGRGRAILPSGVWLYVHDPEFRVPAQGWKLHLSALPATLLETLDRVLPIVLSRPCMFKVARSSTELHRLNSSDTHLGGAGKALTIYPAPGDVVELGSRLADELAGLEGPRILSDRRLRPDSPVYYRYGPFLNTYEANEDGDLDLVLSDPAGGTHHGMAEGTYFDPPWSPDPFAAALLDAATVPGPAAPHATAPEPTAPPAPPAPPQSPADTPETSAPASAAKAVIGGRYGAECALSQRGKGGVYRARDLAEDRPVIIREARAHIDVDRHGRDARERLRNERHVLEVLQELDLVPNVLDHFRHGEDEYLVTTDMGARSLNDDVAENGPYPGTSGDPAGRDLRTLAERLLNALDRIHRHGVIVRDLTPKNIVLDADHRPTLVDFEISHIEGPVFHGFTAGYTPPGQERDEPAAIEDDYYALGATLFYAATGIPPVWFENDERNHDTGRAEIVLDGRGGMSATILGLLDLDPQRRRETAEEIRAGRFQDRAPTPRARSGAAFDLDRVIDHTLDKITDYAERLVTGATLNGGTIPNPTNLYRGCAGVGMEMLHYRDRPEVRDRILSMAHWTCGFLSLRRSNLGLYTGQTGTAVFLATAGAALGDRALTEMADRLARLIPAMITERDQHCGLAGIATGQLLLWHFTRDPLRLETATDCIQLITAVDPAQTLADDAPDYADCVSLSRTLGFAHGLAGTAHALLAHHTATGQHLAETTHAYDLLAEHFPHVLAAARSSNAKPMHGSFCQGLAGMGATLLRAAEPCGQERYIDLARDAADACADLATKIHTPCQCCGLAGVGELFLDLARTTGDTAYRAQAERIAQIILSRAGGTTNAPIYLDSNAIDGAWSTGIGGVLTFLRRLREPAATRLWLDPL